MSSHLGVPLLGNYNEEIVDQAAGKSNRGRVQIPRTKKEMTRERNDLKKQAKEENDLIERSLAKRDATI
ncbi:hypothetical protein BgiBS90_033330 [Biomphalaria glabrata]|nr:hypothetical protein BgiBS90_033330 [Biomphalaria glabrata]